MSSISGVNANFGFEALAASMTKRSSDAQEQAVMSLLEGTAQANQQINAAGARAVQAASQGSTIDVYA